MPDEAHTIDNAYFHVDNGGLELDVIERPSDTFGPTYDLKVSFSHMGAGIDVTFPLGSMEIVGWLAQTMTTLLVRMEAAKSHGRHLAFEFAQEAQVHVQDGERLAEPLTLRWVPGKGLRSDDR